MGCCHESSTIRGIQGNGVRIGQITRTNLKHVKWRFKGDGGIVFEGHYRNEMKLVRTVRRIHVAYLRTRPEVAPSGIRGL